MSALQLALARLARGVRRLRGVSRAPTPLRAAEPPQRVFPPCFVPSVPDEDGRAVPRTSIHGREVVLVAPLEWEPRGGLRDTPAALTELHAMEYLEGLEPDDVERLALDWIASNPLEGRGGARPGWSGAALARRCVVWMQQIALRERAFGEQGVATLLRSLALQLRSLELRMERERDGLRPLEEARALLWAGRFFAGPEAARWTRVATTVLAARLDERVRPDGVHRERSPALHLGAFAHLLECRAVLAEGELRGRLDATLERMAQATADLTHPDGGVSLIGASGPSTARSAAACLAVYRKLCGKHVEAREAFGLEETGFYGVRSGASLLVFDAGPNAGTRRPREGCADVFAFEWSVEGRRLIVDAGAADGGPAGWREHARSTRAHNTVTLEGLDQEIFAGRRRRARVERTRYERFGSSILVEGVHEGYSHLPGRPRHHRRLTATALGLSIEDFIEGGEGQEVRAGLLLHPDVEVRRRGRTVVLVSGPLVVVLETRHRVSVTPAWWFPEPGVKRRTQQLVLQYPDAPCSGKFRLERLEAGSTRWHVLRREARPIGRTVEAARAA